MLILNFEIILNIINTIKLIITIVDPVGVFNIYELISPIINDIMDIITLDITTLLKFLYSIIDDIVGNIIKLDINSEPISLIPSTTTIEHNVANKILYKLVFIPMLFANLSSNVIANILLYEKIYKLTTNTDNTILIIISISLIDNIDPNK